jgi:hypothetical protein
MYVLDGEMGKNAQRMRRNSSMPAGVYTNENGDAADNSAWRRQSRDRFLCRIMMARSSRMKRDTLFEKLEIILVVETLILLLAMINEPSANAKQPTGPVVPARVNSHIPMFKLC